MLYNKEWEVPAEAKPLEHKPLEQWRQDLLSAADLIRKYGWRRGSYGTIDTGYCTLGALRVVTGHLDTEASRKFREALRPTRYIPVWNDRVAKSKEEVIAKLEEVAQG